MNTLTDAQVAKVRESIACGGTRDEAAAAAGIARSALDRHMWPGGQPDGLTALVKGKTVPVAVEGNDRFGRVLARIQIDGHDLGERLVSEGMA